MSYLHQWMMRIMMGQTAVQDQPFYAFNLEDHVPQGHLLRGVDRFLDLSELRQHLAPFYSHTGRPSIDPELMIRMLVINEPIGLSPTMSKNNGITAWILRSIEGLPRLW